MTSFEHLKKPQEVLNWANTLSSKEKSPHTCTHMRRPRPPAQIPMCTRTTYTIMLTCTCTNPCVHVDPHTRKCMHAYRHTHSFPPHVHRDADTCSCTHIHILSIWICTPTCVHHTGTHTHPPPRVHREVDTCTRTHTHTF